MNNVVSLRNHIETRWESYVQAQRRAQITHSVEDGIAAGKAWREWLNLFMTSEQRNFVEGPRGGIIG